MKLIVARMRNMRSRRPLPMFCRTLLCVAGLLTGAWSWPVWGEPAVIDSREVPAAPRWEPSASSSRRTSGALIGFPMHLGHQFWERFTSLPATPSGPGTLGGRPASHLPFVSTRPLRLFRLVSGERFHAEWLAADRHRVAYRIGPELRGTLLRDDVAEIGNPSGIADVWDETFESAAPPAPAGESRGADGSWDGADWRRQPAAPMAAGFLRIWWRVPEDDFSSPSQVVLEFGDEEVQRLVAEVDERGAVSVRPPAGWRTTFTQPAAAIRGRWESLTCWWNDVRWSVATGETLRAAGEKPATPLESVWLKRSGDRPGVAWDDLVLRRTGTPREDLLRRDPTQDALVLADGVVLYGRMVGTTQNGVVWAGKGGEIEAPWSAFRRVVLRDESPSRGWQTLICGDVGWRETAPVAAPYPMVGERWLMARPKDLLGPMVGDHPLLGRIGWSGHVDHGGERICWQWLMPQSVHLGDEIRGDLSPDVPVGTSVAGRFTLPIRPREMAWISCELAEIEPSGPATPPTERFLNRLRAGELVSELWVNGMRIGTWNEHLAWRPPRDLPQRVRMPIPPDVLQRGVNAWEVRQRPAADGQSYDDLQLGRMALEFVDSTQ